MTTRSELRKVRANLDGKPTRLWFHRWVDVVEAVETGHCLTVKDLDVPLVREIMVTKALVEDNVGNVFTIGINQFKFI